MKKFLSLAIISLLMMSYVPQAKAGIIDSAAKVVMAQKDSIAAEMAMLSDSSKLTFAKVYTDVKAGMVGLAEGLKVGVEHVYKILVIQQVVNAVMFCALALIGSILLILSYKLWGRTKFGTGYNSDELREGRATDVLGAIVFGLFGFICLGIGIGHIDVIAMGFINPEYGAIRDIISFIK
jgi:hypothetical protein